MINFIVCDDEKAITESVKKIIDPSMPEPHTIVYIILGFSILGKLWLAIFNRKMSKDIDSSTLKATSQDSLNDAISTTVVLIVTIICHVFSNVDILKYLDIIWHIISLPPVEKPYLNTSPLPSPFINAPNIVTRSTLSTSNCIKPAIFSVK